jgi:hypothetical protein
MQAALAAVERVSNARAAAAIDDRIEPLQLRKDRKAELAAIAKGARDAEPTLRAAEVLAENMSKAVATSPLFREVGHGMNPPPEPTGKNPLAALAAAAGVVRKSGETSEQALAKALKADGAALYKQYRSERRRALGWE